MILCIKVLALKNNRLFALAMRSIDKGGFSLEFIQSASFKYGKLAQIHRDSFRVSLHLPIV